MEKEPQNYLLVGQKRIPVLSGLFTGILAVSTASLLIRFAQRDMPSLLIAAGRMTIAALVLLPILILRNREKLKQIELKTWYFLMLAGFFLGLHFAAWITSLEYTTVASSVVFVTTAPLWVSLLSPIFLKEHLTRKVLIGLVIALAGSLVVALSSSCHLLTGSLRCDPFGSLLNGRIIFGNLLALAGAFLSAGYLIVGRKVRHELNLIPYSTIVYTIAAIVLISLVVISGVKISGYPKIDYLWLIALAIIPQLIGHSAFNWALKYLSAAFVSIALLGEPIGSVILAYLFLSENPTILEITGGFLILSGIFIATRTTKPDSETPL